MSIERYNIMKSKYHDTKPIRGRSEDIRPIGERRRDWERVVQDGENYGAQLYDTKCVMFRPDGSIELRIDTWATPTTTAFIEKHCRYALNCFKRYGSVWIEVGGKTYPLPKDGMFLLNFVNGDYVPAEIPKLQQRVVDRTKSRDVRLQVQGFRDYCRNMLKLADGWITRDLFEQYGKPDKNYWGKGNVTFRGKTFTSYDVRDRIDATMARDLFDYMRTATEDEYPNLLVLITVGANSQESRVVRTEDFQQKYHDGTTRTERREIREYCYRPQTVLTRIEYICKKANDVTKVVEVEAGEVLTNLV